MTSSRRAAVPAKAARILHTPPHRAEVLITNSQIVADRWDEASALFGYTVGGLAGHLARAVLTVDGYLDRPSPSGEPAGSADYFVRVLGTHDPVAADLHVAVRDRASQEAGHGPEALVARVRAARLRLESRLTTIDGGTTIDVLDGTVMTVEAYLETRLVELVVHLDDLAVSVGLDVAVDINDQAYAVVASVLAQVAAARAGGLTTVRSLARRERQAEAVRAL